ncbi:hypothetical protein YC2023_115547 [Brassica napus]
MKVCVFVEVFWVRVDRDEEIYHPIGIVMGSRGFFENQGIEAIYVSKTESKRRRGGCRRCKIGGDFGIWVVLGRKEEAWIFLYMIETGFGILLILISQQSQWITKTGEKKVEAVRSEELEDWEQGEITDGMEEEEHVGEGVEEGEQAVLEADAGETDVADPGKAPLKKGVKAGNGGAPKKRSGPGFVSPRKKLLAKVAKAGDKGAKKASNKP